MDNQAQAIDFDHRFRQKGNVLLDSIFSTEPDLRPLVSLKTPRECRLREVVFQVEYKSPDEFSNILLKIGDWLKEDSSPAELESLMLF